jgi:hypothetical protein
MGHAPSELLEITVWVTADLGSYTLRNETPASSPSSITVLSCLPSQKPRLSRIDCAGTSLRGRTISATHPAGTIRPVNSDRQNAVISATVE